MRILYLDCFSGISGDMTLASLVDAGADREYVEKELHKLDIDPFAVEWKTVVKQGITALKADVVATGDPSPGHRHYTDIVDIIRQAGLHDSVTRMSLAIFEKIGVAEAKIHGIPLEKVHFHEVGAVDSIVDAVGVALALHSLQVDQIIASPVPLGSGSVKCDHGTYPVPAPATLEMMKGIPIAASRFPVELTTPTGAGIVSALVDEFAPSLPSMIVSGIGYGAGTRDLPGQPNVLRAIVGEKRGDTVEKPSHWPTVHRHDQAEDQHPTHHRH